MMVNNDNPICPVRWILHMVHTIPAQAQHNLFCFTDRRGNIVPIMYRDLMVNLRNWSKLIGIKDPNRYSSHSLRRGATTAAFNADLPEKVIMEMGGWTSQCYKQYIEIDMHKKLSTWCRFAKRK